MFSRGASVRGFSSKTSLKKRPAASIYDDDDINVDDLGGETEAEKQMKVLLDKQLNTKISLKEQFSQHRSFTCPSTYNSLTELIKGTCTLDKFKAIEQNEEIHQELQRCGLSEEEISDYLLFKSGKKKENSLIDPSVWNEKMQMIEDKIKAHNDNLLKPQMFSNVKKLTRHEMEIEKALYAGCADKNKLSSLVTLADDDHPKEINSAFDYIKNLSEKLLHNYKKKKKRKIEDIKNEVKSVLDSNVCETEQPNFQYDPAIHHVVVPLEESEIKEKRLTVDEIRKLPKFETYKMGNPNKTLYLKNLHSKITSNELRSIFNHFEVENDGPIEYKICTGRMKGQAFIKFTDSKIAEKALGFANGYTLRGKPIIIEFGRKS